MSKSYLAKPYLTGALALVSLVVATPALAADPTAKYTCDDGTRLVARFHNAPSGPGSLTLTFKDTGKKMTIPQTMSADGGRYAEGQVEFWIKGNQASFTRGAHKATCRTGGSNQQ